ncbi:MAG: AAA family ATPase [Elusimicrobia bacterium]|nr:AAA family ATPase [Elusimicrobiota bacterium]
MKIAISGKGGSGKTTISAVLGYLFSRESKRVFLIDADPDGNLGLAMGFSDEELSKVVPIVELKEIIAERTASNGGGYFKLNPEVDDIPEKFSIRKDNIRMLVLGNIKKGGSGCYCPENAFLRSVLRNLLSQKQDVVILDMPAGIEHLGRATADSMDSILIVVEPTAKSVQTAKRIHKLSADIKIKKILFVGNKISGEVDKKFLDEAFYQNSEMFIGYIGHHPSITNAEQKRSPVYTASEKLLNEISSIKEALL